MPKSMTLRLNDDLAILLEATTQTDDMSVSEAIRVAITGHIKSRRRDPEFQQRVHRHIEAQARALERLMGPLQPD
jgi:hypothetical protein